MEVYMRVNGLTAKSMEREERYLMMAMYIQESLKMIKLKVMENLIIKTGHDIKANSKTIYKMGKEQKSGQMELNLLGNLLMGKNVAKANKYGKITQIT